MGTGGPEPGEKGREAGEERVEAGVPRWREPGETETISQKGQSTKRRESLQKEAESGSKSYGMRE